MSVSLHSPHGVLVQKLITVRGEKQALDTQLNRLQHKVKDLGEDFRARLVKYVEDIAVRSCYSELTRVFLLLGVRGGEVS